MSLKYSFSIPKTRPTPENQFPHLPMLQPQIQTQNQAEDHLNLPLPPHGLDQDGNPENEDQDQN